MKLKLTVIAIAFSATIASGTTLAVNTGGAFATQNLIDSTGSSLVSSGCAAIGVWSGTAAITDYDSFISEFTIGNYDNGSGLVDTTTPIETFSDFGSDADGFDTGQFLKSSTPIGSNIVVAFWKGSLDRSVATELVVLQLGALYENGASPTEIDFSTTPAGTGGTDMDGFIYGNSRFQTTILPVPEPSSMALLGLGGVALLLRRRR